ncbi:hypothetical protein F5H01DRAFT_348151 [Linnemannia elongata]|nr:hypothetical protein F5H01DRAFT_348151 [Linnemannia elongata]
MATTPTRSRGKSPLTLVDTQRHQPDLRRRSMDTAQQPTSPSSSAKQRKALSRITTPPRTMIVDLGSSSGGSSSSRPQEQQQQEGEEVVTEEIGEDNADETHTPEPSTLAGVETTEDGEGEEESTVTDSPFLVFPPGRINIRRQGGGYRESGLNCTTPTRPRHGGANNWIGDLFSRGRLTRSRRTQDDELVELDHNNVTRREVEEAEEYEDEDEDDAGDDDSSGGGFKSPVTPRSQFGRWKFGIMMSQSTMKPPKLNVEDAISVEEDHGNDDDNEDDGEADENGEGDVGDDTEWPFGNSQIESDPSTPKRRPSKIPRGRFMSPTSPTFRDSGCDDREAVEDDHEEAEDDVRSDQDVDASKDDSQILDSFSNSQQEQIAESGDNGLGSSSSSSNWSGMSKPPKLNLRHLGGLPCSPSESSSASFHTPPRKRTHKDIEESYGLRRPPPAPKLISSEQVLQFFPTHSQSPSVLKSLQLRRGASNLEGSFNYSSSNR